MPELPPALQTIVDDFEVLDDAESRYTYLIDMGKQLPPLPDALKTEENRVRGCTSQVWMVTSWPEGKLHLQLDSDALIVRGLCALLTAAYEGQTPETVKTLPIEDIFNRLHLQNQLSPNRRNGFASMVGRLRATAD